MLKGMPEGLLELLERTANLDAESFRRAGWLVSDFPQDTWEMLFGKVRRFVDWRVPFGTGLLTDFRYSAVRNLFKSFIIAQTHPSTTNGRIIDSDRSKHLVALGFRVLDYFLLHQEELELPRYGLQLITSNDIATILYRFETGPTDNEAVYDWAGTLERWLSDQVQQSLDAVNALVDRHPVFGQLSYPKEEWSLTVDDSRLAQFRAVLWLRGVYQRARQANYRFSPATTSLARHLYANTLAGKSAKPVFEELCLFPVDKYVRERKGVDVRTGEGDGPSISYLRSRSAALSSMSVLGRAGFDVPIDVFDTAREYTPVNSERIARPGRYRNPPVWQVVDGMKNGVEFTLDYGEALFESYANVLKAARAEGTTPYLLTLNCDIRQFLARGALEMGVTQWCLRTHAGSWSVGKRRLKARDSERWSKERFYEEFRRGRGLLQNISVFYGGFLHVVGPITARRQHELLRLPVRGCLDASREFIVFKNGKSGAAGILQEEVRPVPPVIGHQIALIEQLHEHLAEVPEFNASGMLLAMPGFKGMRVPNVPLFNDALDAFSDFFETPLTQDGRRHYLREHQFRRFLIIAFFFGARHSNLETLRWFVGHTDAEHLWNYLTNSIPGDMHREAAAYFLMDELQLPEEERVIEMHEKVREELELHLHRHFGTRKFSMIDADSLEDYLNLLLRKGMVVEPVFFPSASGQQYKIVVNMRRLG